MPQVIEGTIEEIVALLRNSAFAGRRARVVFESDEQDFTSNLPEPTDALRDGVHLNQLLMEGLASPGREITDADWQELRRRAERRINGKSS